MIKVLIHKFNVISHLKNYLKIVYSFFLLKSFIQNHDFFLKYNYNSIISLKSLVLIIKLKRIIIYL